MCVLPSQLFLLPNAIILDHSLPFTARLLGAVLYDQESGDCRMTLSQMASVSECSITTVRNCLQLLEIAGYISRHRGYRYNTASYTHMSLNPESCTPIPRDIFSRRLDPSAFSILLFLYYKAWSAGGSFPSLRMISKAVGMSVATVCRSLKAIGQARRIYTQAETAALLAEGHVVYFGIALDQSSGEEPG